MKKETLAEAIGNVEERLIKEAEGAETEEIEEIKKAEETEEVKEKTKAQGKQSGRRFWRSWPQIVATAAAVLFLVAAGGWALFDKPEKGATGDTGSHEPTIDGETAGNNMTTAGGPDSDTSLDGLPAAYDDMLVAKAMSMEVVGADDYERLYEIRKENPVTEEFYGALEEFAFRVTAALAAERPEEERSSNMLYSPLSLYYALALAAQGAEGETQEELLGVLAAGSDADWLAGQCGNLYRTLYRENEQGNFKLANSVWMAREWSGQTLSYKAPFLETGTGEFYASLFAADFGKQETAKAMGGWVAEQTGGLLQPDFAVNEDQIMDIINTIYLKDEWREAFQEENTAADSFRLADGSESKVDFMNRVDFRTVWKGKDFTRAALDLKQTGEMVFVLPDEGVDIEELLASPERVREIFEGGEELYGEVTWKVPKFTFGEERSLIALLEGLGVSKAFSAEQANFSGIVDLSVYVSEVRQGAKLSVNENGVEAAAFTELGMNTGGEISGNLAQVEMILNRPFIYAVYTGGSMTFFGVCGNPG